MNPQQRREYWQVFNSFQQSREKKYAPAIARALNQQKAEFISQYKQGNNNIYLLNPKSLQTVVRDLYFDAAIVFGAKVRASLVSQKARMPIGFNERMQQLIEQYYGLDFLNQSLDITETTRDILHRVLIKAQAEGKGFDDILDMLEGVDISRNRSRLIARTETVTAANSGAHLSAKESGIQVKKVWIATQDNRTREEHYRVSPDAIDMEEGFNVNGYFMLHPGIRKQVNGLPVPAKLVCNCRCVEAHQPIRDRNGRVLTT